MNNKIDIKGIDKAKVLQALYAVAKPQGMSFMHYRAGDLSIDECRILLSSAGKDLYFDYVLGRVMKVNLSGDSFDPWGFDRDNGQGAAQAAIDALKRKEAIDA